MTQAFTGELDPIRYNDPKYDEYAVQAANKVGIPPQLLLAVKNQGEKSDVRAVSPKGAVGLMQFMPETWKRYGTGRDPRNPTDSIDAGAEYVRDLLAEYKGNAKAVLAHYNGGYAAGNAVLAGNDPPVPETQKYLKRIYGEGQQGTPFSGSLDTEPQPLFQGELDSPQTQQAFSGELDTPGPTTPSAFSGELDPTPVQTTTGPDNTPWDGTGGVLTGIVNGVKDIYNNPVESGKQVLSSGAKLVDTATGLASGAISYAGGAAAGLISGSSDVAKQVKDDISSKLSIDKKLQDLGVASDNPEPFTGALDTVIGKPARIVADATTTPGTFANDAVRDATIMALPIGGHIGLKKLADRTTTPKLFDKDAPEGQRPQVQSELFPEDPAQVGAPTPFQGELDIAPKPLPAKLEDAIGQARLELNKPDFKDAQKAFDEFDNRGIPDQTQGKLFSGELDAENPAYPNQTPAVPEALGPETQHPNVVTPWTTGETYLGPDTPMYRDQNELFTQPLDGLIDQAKYSSEPRPEPLPKALPPPAPDVFPTEKYVQGDLGLDKPDLLSKQLDVAGEDMNGTYWSDLVTGDEAPKFPTASEYMEKKDLPMVLSPSKVMDTFGMTPKNVPKANGQLIREILPNWAKRDLWNENPILRSNFDNLTHLRDVKNGWLRDILEPKKLEDGTTYNPRKDLDSLSSKEKNDFAHFTIEHEGAERTPKMIEEGRNYYNAREWRDRGASDKVSKALEEAGIIYQKALEGYNKDAGLRGDQPIDVITNYFPHRHVGDFFVKITDMRNGQQEVIPFRSLKEAKEATKRIQPDVKAGYSIDYGRKPRGGSDFNDLLEALKDRTEKYRGSKPSPFNNMLTKIRQSMDEEFFAGAENRHGEGHYTGEEGFIKGEKPKGTKAEDVEHVAGSAPKYAEDMASYLMGKRINDLKEAYQKAAEDHGIAHTGNWLDNKKALEKQADLYQGPTFNPEKSTSIENFADGISKIMDRESIVAGHAPVPWLTRDVLTRRVRNLNKLAGTLLITPYMNTALAISQFGQLLSSPLNVIGELSRTLGTNEIPKGFIGQLKQSGKAIPFIAEAFSKGLWDAMAPESLTPAKGNEALKWAKNLGHLDTMLKHENLDVKGKIKRTVTFQGVSMVAEHVPRSITFMQGYHAFKRLGFNEMAARRASVEFTNTVMGDYTKEGKIEGMRAMGPLAGTALSPFSTWLWNSKAQVGALATSLGTHGVKSLGAGTIIPLTALAASVYFITGWGGAPGVQDYDQLAKMSNDSFDTNLPTSANINLEHGKDMFGSDKAANTAYYGAASEASGRDIAQSSRFGSLTDVAVPGIALAKTLGKAAYYGGKKALSKTGLVETPTDSQMYQNMRAATPPAFKTLIEDYYSKSKPDGTEVLKSGIVRKPDESIKKLLGIPFNDLDEKKQADVNAVANYVKLRQSKMADRQLELIQDKVNSTIEEVKNLTSLNLPPEQEQQRLYLEREKLKLAIKPNLTSLTTLNPDYAVASKTIENKVIDDQIKRKLTQQEYESFKAASGKSINNQQDARRRSDWMNKVLNSK